MRISRLISSILLLSIPALGMAQGSSSGSNLTQILLISLVILLIILVVTLVADSFLKVEARSSGASKTGDGFGIIPSKDELFANDLPKGLDRADVHFLSRGFNIDLQGEAKTNQLLQGSKLLL